jgi:hypothetical protein
MKLYIRFCVLCSQKIYDGPIPSPRYPAKYLKSYDLLLEWNMPEGLIHDSWKKEPVILFLPELNRFLKTLKYCLRNSRYIISLLMLRSEANRTV